MERASPGVVAHRGGALLWPENSLMAVRGALALGIDGVEIDVHQTKDGQVLVLHDPDLERTTTGLGPVRELTAEKARRFVVRGTEGEPVPLLEEVLVVVEPTSAFLSLEIKVDGEGRAYEGIEARILEALRATRMERRVLVHAFDWDVLARMRKLDVGMPLAGNVAASTVERHGSMAGVLDALAARGILHLNADYRLLDPLSLARAKELGMAVTVWTVNDDGALAHWLAAGVHYVVTDRPDAALAMRLAPALVVA